MRVIATAGHVDHGKSTLVRSLTGTDPDRWAEEHRRGLTIDLGYVWTTLPSGQVVSFVDVPGHQRFIGNMLAGLGPAPAVLLVVAADAGWSAQTSEHLDAICALGLTRGVVALTRADLVTDQQLDATRAQVAEQLGGTGLAGAPVVACSGTTGQGLDQLCEALDALCARIPAGDADGDVRLWIDRVFTMTGAGTVVTGTLGQGTVRVGDQLALHTEDAAVEVSIRGLQSLEQPRTEVTPPARVALNLRGVPTQGIGRGDVLLTARAWHLTTQADVRVLPLREGAPLEALPEHLMAHLGTRADQVRLRPLGADAWRLTWPHPLPLRAGDRMVLRDPGRRRVLAGALVLDANPPALRRRGEARARGELLAGQEAGFDLPGEVSRRGHLTREAATALGARAEQIAAAVAAGAVLEHGGLLVCPAQWQRWAADLARAAREAVEREPLQARVPVKTLADALGLPAEQGRSLVTALAQQDEDLDLREGYVHVRGVEPSLGAAEAGLAEVERRLAAAPFRAPEREELAELGLGPKQIALAVRLGRVVDLGDQILLAPRGPAQAMGVLARLPQPFTTSQARQALDTTRRVAVPLLEHLDRRGWTRRLDAGHRELVR